jgi:hypothetical protein
MVHVITLRIDPIYYKLEMIFVVLFVIVLVYILTKLPLRLPVQIHILRSNNPEYNSTKTYQDVANIIRKANNIWSQGNITIDVVKLDTLAVDGVILERAAVGETKELEQLLSISNDDANIRHIYFIGKIAYATYGETFPHYKTVFISDHTDDRGDHYHAYYRTLAHELGHTMSLLHVANEDDLMATGGAQGINLEMWQIVAARSSLIVG